jgi:hypothetical protein
LFEALWAGFVANTCGAVLPNFKRILLKIAEIAPQVLSAPEQFSRAQSIETAFPFDKRQAWC